MPIWLIIVWLLGGMVFLQFVILAILTARSRLRRGRVPPAGFPFFYPDPAPVDNTEVQIYCEGRQLFEDMLAAIESAEKNIYLETYIWKGDELGERFKQALIDKAAQGVDVYLIYDTFANLVVPRSFFHFPSEIHVLPYRAWRRPWHAFDFRRYGRDHRKILIVDDKSPLSAATISANSIAPSGAILTCA